MYLIILCSDFKLVVSIHINTEEQEDLVCVCVYEKALFFLPEITN